MQYSHCSRDTARRRWAGRAGAGQGVQALGRLAGRGRSAGGQAAVALAGLAAGVGARSGRSGRSGHSGARSGRSGARRRGAQVGRRRGRRRGSAGSAARGLGMPVRAGWACWLVSWAKLVHCAPGLVLTQF